MKLACCVWALNFWENGPVRLLRKFLGGVAPETFLLEAMAELGFSSFDIQPNMQRSEASKSTLQKLGLQVSCISLSHFAPEAGSFHTRNPQKVQVLMDYLRDGIDHAASIGVDRAYIVPGKADDHLSVSDYADHYATLAEYGQSKGVKIGIEHFPDTALPTVQATLDFITEVNHPNLYLLFDIGHAQISKEDPAEVLPQVGDCLCYVHLDDNDGECDLHLPLTEGVLSREDLESLIKVLSKMNYRGPVSLELHPRLPNSYQALVQSKRIVDQLYHFDYIT